MQTNKEKWIGVLIMACGVALSAFFFWYFKFDGLIISYKDTSLLLKYLFTIAFLPLGLYLGLYFYGGRKNANQVGGLFFLTLVIIIAIGYLFHH